MIFSLLSGICSFSLAKEQSWSIAEQIRSHGSLQLAASRPAPGLRYVLSTRLVTASASSNAYFAGGRFSDMLIFLASILSANLRLLSIFLLLCVVSVRPGTQLLFIVHFITVRNLENAIQLKNRLVDVAKVIYRVSLPILNMYGFVALARK
ncbi:hypothetical protein V1523DRAFT_417136 [Lipomyces doorenjongii]